MELLSFLCCSSYFVRLCTNELNWGGRTALLWAIGEGCNPIVKFLIEADADKEAKDKVRERQIDREGLQTYTCIGSSRCGLST